MIDTIRIKQPIRMPSEANNRCPFPIEWNGLSLYPNFHQELGYVKSYTKKMENMRVSICDDWLYIDNSLHKFFKGNNHSDFTQSDLIKSIQKLNDELNINLRNAEIKKLSYGCNLDVNSNTYKSWNYYKHKQFKPMNWSGVEYGAFCKMTEYKCKGYDKTKEVKIHTGEQLEKQNFRYEVEISNMRHLQKRKEPISIYRVNDLLQESNLFLLMNDLITKSNKIETVKKWDYGKLSIEEKKIIAVMENHEIRTDLAKNHKDSLKRYRSRYKAMSSRFLNNPSTISNQIKSKFSHLLNS